MTETVVVEKVSKSYGHVKALNGLSLHVQEGEIFGLLGANGAGKTTLIKIFVGALKADVGNVRVLGLDPEKQKFDLRPRVGYMPQQLALYDDLSARENVQFFGTARQIPNLKKRVDEVLDFLALGDRAGDPVYGFSGGMKQRVSLACALVHQPKLLLLDEPTTGVDPKLRESLWSHFHDLTQQGVTIVVSTHQMDEAFHCNRVAVMRGGVALATDTPRGLMARGHAKVTLWRDGQAETHQMTNYRDELPQLLGVQDSVSKIEVEEDTLENVVLNLIAVKEVNHA
ncbi:MAG: ABC transporter ATP-binding protein [Anaerolineae bacterium]|nr:ABC transporter ATP-binding protein [Anaerolineae bacterium]